MSPQQIVKTICLRSIDAIEKKGSRLTFELTIDEPRFKAVKVALGSLEFPCTQYSIEQEWSNIYFNEGIALDETSNNINFEMSNGESFELRLPPRLNEIKSWRAVGTRIIAECTHPHGLDMVEYITWGDVEIVASPFGRVSLRDYQLANKLQILSDTSFSIPNTQAVLGMIATFPIAGVLYVPTIPGPKFLATLLNMASARCDILSFGFSYKDDNRFEVTIKNKMEESVRVHWKSGGLARHIGLCISEIRIKAEEKITLTTDMYRAWDYSSLSVGWYGPSHRPLSTAPPLRFPQEAENALNRLHFSLPERVKTGDVTSHFLVFTDPCGILHTCPVLCGRYNPINFCEHLETEMTKLALRTMENVSFTVEYVEERFVFSCEVKTDNGIQASATFTLMFNHPLQFDPQKIGFPAQPLSGSDSYASEPVHFPSMNSFYKNIHYPKNIYRVSEIGHQKKLQFHATQVPALNGVILSYNTDQSILALRTYLAQLPYVHGYEAGTILRISPAKSTELFEFDENTSKWSEATVENCALAPVWGRTAIVLNSPSTTTNQYHTSIVHIRVRQTPQLNSCVGKTIQLHAMTEPFNFNFSLPKSIKPNIVGFEPLVLWGRDGVIKTGELHIPPFLATKVHSFDHPDYVIMTLEEGKGANLQHVSGSNNRQIFAKIVLYPLAREMGMMPRDVSLAGGSNLNRFTFGFYNPDMTEYQFHDGNVSFSLNLIDVINTSE